MYTGGGGGGGGGGGALLPVQGWKMRRKWNEKKMRWKKLVPVAQRLTEHSACNQKFGGSSPTRGELFSISQYFNCFENYP